MNSKEAVERMREIEKRLSQGIAYNWFKFAKLQKQEAKEIYEKFKDGCGQLITSNTDYDGKMVYCMSHGVKCKNCQEIKEIWERIK